MAADASLIYATHMNLDIDDPAIWVPSERWCFWFLSEIAGYVKRRVTQVVSSIEQIEVHKRVHEYNVRQIAYLISKGMKLKYLSGSDGKGRFSIDFGLESTDMPCIMFASTMQRRTSFLVPRENGCG